MTYVGKWGRGKRMTVATSEEIHVRYRRKVRPTGRTIGGLFTEVEPDGKDTSAVEVTMVDAVGDLGTKRSIGYGLIPLGNAHDHIRELSVADVARLREFDEEIAEWQEQIRALRKKRRTFLRRAFHRGRTVGVGTLREFAETKS